MDAYIFSGFNMSMEHLNLSPFSSPVIKGKQEKYEIEPIHDSFIEPILQENPTRFTLFPIMKPNLFQKYKNHVSVFWTPEEIDLSKDMKDWVKLSQNEQMFIKNILGFFAGSDGIIQENLVARFMNEIQLAEARQFYSVQLMMEAVHCVSPDTDILTDKGYFNIKSLVEQKINVWNGIEFSEVTVKKTSDSSRLYKVLLDNGMELDCTDEHKWLVRTGNQTHSETCKIEKIFTKNLRKGDIIGHFDYPVINCSDPDEFKNPYTHGFFCGDGTYSKKALPYLDTSSYITNQINKEKYFVPLNYSINTKLRWIEGLFDADASINASKNGYTSIQYTSVNYEFIKQVQLLLSTLGVYSNMKCVRDKCTRMLPDGEGGEAKYECQPVYCLYITQFYVNKLENILDEQLRKSKTLLQNISELVTHGSTIEVS